MVFLPFCLMPGMSRSLQHSKIWPKMRPKKRKRPGQPPQTPAELSLMQEQRPLSRGALLFWFSGRRQRGQLTRGQRGRTASTNISRGKDITLPKLLHKPEEHGTAGVEPGDIRVKPFTLRQGPMTVPSTLQRTGNTRPAEAYMNELSARLPSDPESERRQHTPQRQVSPGFPRAVLVSGRGPFINH